MKRLKRDLVLFKGVLKAGIRVLVRWLDPRPAIRECGDLGMKVRKDLFPRKISQFLSTEWPRLLSFVFAFLVVIGFAWLLWCHRPSDGISTAWVIVWITGLALSIVLFLLLTATFWVTYNPTGYVSLVAVFIAAVTAFYTAQQASLLRHQIRLENRPFVSIEQPLWWFSRDEKGSVWLWLGLRQNNYGDKPAEEVKLRNFRALDLTINEEALEKKIREGTHEEAEKYVDEYVLDTRNQIILGIMKMLMQFFREYPDASKEDARLFVEGLISQKPKSGEFEVGYYGATALFGVEEVANDMQVYLSHQNRVLFPNQSIEFMWTLQIGGGIKNVLEGTNVLVVLLGYEYQSTLRDVEYSTFYLGYSDRNFSQRIKKGEGGAFLREFQVWTDEHPVKVR